MPICASSNMSCHHLIYEKRIEEAVVVLLLLTPRSNTGLKMLEMKEENKGSAIIITKDTETPQTFTCSYPFLLS